MEQKKLCKITNKTNLKLFISILLMVGICLLCGSVKAFTLTLTPIPNENAIQLNWDNPEGNLYKIWQLKPGATSYQSISTINVDRETEPVKVLNLYPVSVPRKFMANRRTNNFYYI